MSCGPARTEGRGVPTREELFYIVRSPGGRSVPVEKAETRPGWRELWLEGGQGLERRQELAQSSWTGLPEP